MEEKLISSQTSEISPSQELYELLIKLRGAIDGKELVPVTLAVFLIDLAIRLNSETQSLSLVNALLRYKPKKRGRGRPKKSAPATTESVVNNRGRPSVGLVCAADIFLEKLPHAIEGERFQKWRLSRGKRKSESAALEYMSELVYKQMGERQTKAASHLKALKNKIAVLRKTVPK